MGPVECAIRDRFKVPPAELYTYGQHKRFELIEIDEDGIVLQLGEGKWPTRLHWEAGCLESIPDFLRGKGCVVVGGLNQTWGKPGTLDEHLKKNCTKTNVARWLAVVLAEAGVVDVQKGPPLCVRLRPGFGQGTACPA